MNALLLDTCVWLDYHLQERAGSADAYRLVEAAARASYPLLIAPHSLKDFWYLFWQSLKRQNMAGGTADPETASRIAKAFAWSALEHILDNATVVGFDTSDAFLALKMQSTHDDYEDNLVVAAALRAKPQFLVTNDASLIAHSPVATVTPKDALEYLELL